MDTVLKLRELRRLRGLSQKDVARLSGIGEKTISSFETGERIDSLKVSQLSTMLKVYGITSEEFFGRKLEEQFDPDSIQQRSVEEDVIARLRALPRAPRGTLLEKFVLMLDATDAMLPSARQRPMLVRPAA